ncbi:MAG: hypothetical protein Ct9H300mP16_00130 [Pseudomonadota bacterium]|nr:MAG: hypothetical protein Ct9H300mP16_00130 [Pseudomonadota bacterium]
MIIDHKNLRTLAREMLVAAGSEGDEPEIVSDNLVDANLLGHDSHGIGMLPRYLGAVRSGELNVNQHPRDRCRHGPADHRGRRCGLRPGDRVGGDGHRYRKGQATWGVCARNPALLSPGTNRRLGRALC